MLKIDLDSLGIKPDRVEIKIEEEYCIEGEWMEEHIKFLGTVEKYGGTEIVTVTNTVSKEVAVTSWIFTCRDRIAKVLNDLEKEGYKIE